MIGMIDRLTPRPKYRRQLPDRFRRLISYVWIITSLALPIAGAAAVSRGVTSLQGDNNSITYEVSSGDTLTAIALRYGVSADDLIQVNGISDPNRIFVGQLLVIPRFNPETGGTVHTINQGETLSAIGRRYGINVDDLAKANGLANINAISAGQQLVIPGVNVEADNVSAADASYTMQRGDSLFRVSLIFGVSVDDLLAANSLPGPNSVYPGLVLRIPASDVVVAAPAVSDVPVADEPEAAEKAPEPRTYVVELGDTLASIAISNEVTVDGLIAANGLSGDDRLYPGLVLNLPEPGAAARPAPAQTAVTHLVLPGETMTQIALRYNVTVSSLSVANGISNPSRITAGMTLSIPAAQAGTSSVVYASVGEGYCEVQVSKQTGTGLFGKPVRDYVLTQRFHSGHAGIDLAGDTGTPIYSADGGTVVFSGWNSAGYGNLVVLDHGNGWRSYYAHLNDIYVGCGEFVPRGTLLGAMGTTGNSTGPHLHFELLRFGVAVNPAGYIRF